MTISEPLNRNMCTESDNLDISSHPSLQRPRAPSSEFVWRKDEEPPGVRRRQLLGEYPAVKTLYGYDMRQAVFTMICVLLQIYLSYLSVSWNWPKFLLLTYTLSGTINHSLLLAIHELSHDNMLPGGRVPNLSFAFVANLPMGFALASTFRRYHMLHHSSQGSDMVDMDLPCKTEAMLFKSRAGRLVWLLLQPLLYGLRPVLMKPLPITKWEILNWGIQMSFNGFVLTQWGPKAMLYLVGGALLGTGVHPLSGHFLEHLEVVESQETYSYYGWLNLLTYNVGYHNEHHDFPQIPGSRLPALKAMIPAYANMPHYNNWVRVLWDFVVKDNINLFCRVKRNMKLL